MIDSTFIWINPDVHLEFNVHRWTNLRNRFFDVLVDNKAILRRGRGGWRIVDMGGVSSAERTWWGTDQIMHLVIPDQEGMMHWVREHVVDIVTPEIINKLIYDKLCSDQTVIQRISDHIVQQATEQVQRIVTAQKAAQHELRMHYDELAGLEVQFVVPLESPEQLYYIVGSELHFISDIEAFRRASKNGKDITIGNIQDDVDVSQVELYDPLHRQR